MNKIIFIAIAFLASVSTAQAQPLDNSSTEILVNIKRIVNTANKLSESPKMVDTLVEIPAKEYPRVGEQEDVATTITKIKPARLKIVQPITKLYNGYVKAGFGNYSTPYLDLHLWRKDPVQECGV